MSAASAGDDELVLEIADGVATIVFNRPAQRNAITVGMTDRLPALLEAVERSAARVLVLRGAGRHFMGGGDVQGFGETLSLDEDARSRHFEGLVRATHPIVTAIRRMPQPVIASVRGVCAGFGVSLVLACDLALAAEDALFVPAYVKLGATPDGGASYFLPRIVGAKRAAQLLLLGEHFGAAQAAEWGLVNRVVAPDALDVAVADWTRKLATSARGAIKETKGLLEASRENGFEAQFDAETAAFARRAGSPEFVEGVRAFLEKRDPRFPDAG